MKRRWYKRLSMAHVYRACRYVFRVMGVWGICLGIHHANITAGMIVATEQAAKTVFIISLACMAFAMIGDLRFEYLEREYIYEQRREERQALKSAQERELHKGA